MSKLLISGIAAALIGEALLVLFLVKGEPTQDEQPRSVVEIPAPVAAPPPEAPAIKKVKVLVAAVDIGPGTALSQDLFHWQDWPEDGLFEGLVIQGRANTDAIFGRVARYAMVAGEPLLPSKVVGNDAGLLSNLLSPGMRAVSIPIDAVSGNSGLISPGDRVDMILILDLQDEEDGGRSVKAGDTVLENLRVIAVDRQLPQPKQAGDHPMPNTVTVEVTPRDARLVALALQMGRIVLTVRSGGSPADSGIAAASEQKPGQTVVADATNGGGQDGAVWATDVASDLAPFLHKLTPRGKEIAVPTSTEPQTPVAAPPPAADTGIIIFRGNKAPEVVSLDKQAGK